MICDPWRDQERHRACGRYRFQRGRYSGESHLATNSRWLNRSPVMRTANTVVGRAAERGAARHRFQCPSTTTRRPSHRFLKVKRRLTAACRAATYCEWNTNLSQTVEAANGAYFLAAESRTRQTLAEVLDVSACKINSVKVPTLNDEFGGDHRQYERYINDKARWAGRPICPA